MSRLHSVVYCPKSAETGDFQGSMVWWRDIAGLGGGAGSLERTRLWGLADLGAPTRTSDSGFRGLKARARMEMAGINAL